MDFSKEIYYSENKCLTPFCKKDKSDLIDVFNTLFSTPQIIYRLVCNGLCKKIYALNSQGLADYLVDLLDESPDVKMTDTHLLFTPSFKILLTDVPSEFIDTVIYNKKNVFLKTEKNTQTKRVKYCMYKFNNKVFFDKIQIVFWVVFCIFVFVPHRFRTLKTLVLRTLLILDVKYKTTTIKTAQLPLPFKGCTDLRSLHACISNPYFYKKISNYIYATEDENKNKKIYRIR